MSPAFAIAEVVWILTASNDLPFLQYWAPVFAKYSDDGKILHGAYGRRLRVHHGMDQLQRAYDTLRQLPDSRQVVLQIWDAKADIPRLNGSPASKDVPCNVQSLLKLRDGKLEWMQIIRSNDMFLGVPHNFVQFTSLQEIVAGWLGVPLGSYNQISDSLHVYDKHRSAVAASVDVQAAENRDSLAVPKEESEQLFQELRRRGDELISADLTKAQIYQIAKWSAPDSFRNLLLILIAESSRRRKWNDEAATASSEISNPVLRQLWERWLALKQKGVVGSSFS
jgi:thymidylate synthase